jgi:hypothetical protein
VNDTTEAASLGKSSDATANRPRSSVDADIKG